MAGRRLPLVLAAGCAIGLAGCSGTPFGDQLARSFSGQAAAPQAPGAAPAVTKPAGAPESAKPSQAKPAGTKPNQANPNPNQANPSQANPNQAKLPANQVPQASSRVVDAKPLRLARPPAPADYRVTIKLPSVDPSAPAEALTKALRSAGLSFEVETIERVRPGASGLGPTVTPAPPPR